MTLKYCANYIITWGGERAGIGLVKHHGPPEQMSHPLEDYKRLDVAVCIPATQARQFHQPTQGVSQNLCLEVAKFQKEIAKLI
jgi:hypothetical protein